MEALEDALQHSKPEIFNTDQGSQYTAAAFTGRLERAGVTISMDGRGRALDNVFIERLWRSVKYEWLYLHGYRSVPELQEGLTSYFGFYNSGRPHQALKYRTPKEVYCDGRRKNLKAPCERLWEGFRDDWHPVWGANQEGCCCSRPWATNTSFPVLARPAIFDSPSSSNSRSRVASCRLRIM